MTTWQIEPLGPWNRPVTKNRNSKWQFKASWTDTVALLTSEIEKLARRGAVAVRIDVGPGDIRLDGMLRANARTGPFPGVVVSFESWHGPLSYASDVNELWQHNVRAIALSLQALRAVDRYGVSKSGEQYAGWRAIEGAKPEFASVDEALRWLHEVVDFPGSKGMSTGLLLRQAASRLHPDRHNGDRTDWDRLDAAKQLLEASP